MNKIGKLSYDEFVKCYLEREKREKPEDNPDRIPCMVGQKSRYTSPYMTTRKPDPE